MKDANKHVKLTSESSLLTSFHAPLGRKRFLRMLLVYRPPVKLYKNEMKRRLELLMVFMLSHMNKLLQLEIS